MPTLDQDQPHPAPRSPTGFRRLTPELLQGVR